MARNRKRQRARVQIGVDEAGKPVYKWASGYTKKELKASADSIKEEYGITKGKEMPVIKKTPTIQAASPAVKAETVQGEEFKVYAERWYTLYKAPHLRGSSKEMYENVLKKHLYPAIGEKPITDISSDELQAFIISYE